jgi:hypothetical protein
VTEIPTAAIGRNIYHGFQLPSNRLLWRSVVPSSGGVDLTLLPRTGRSTAPGDRQRHLLLPVPFPAGELREREELGCLSAIGLHPFQRNRELTP